MEAMEFEKEIEVCNATPEDARGVKEVLYKSWLIAYPNEEIGITIDDVEDRFKDAFTEESLKKSAEKIKNRPEGETLLVAKERDKVVGLARIIVSDKENRLQAIYILPEYQKKGIGRKLWEQAKKLFDEEKDIFVAVATYNNNAIGFYEKLGFKDTGKRWDDDKLKMKSGTIITQMDMVLDKK